MAGGGAASNAPRVRKRVDANATTTATDTSSTSTSLKRAKDGSAFARCEGCNKDVPVVLISMHNCSLDAKIKMNLEAQVVELPTEVKKKSTEKRKSNPLAKKGKKGKNSKDPNAPKRPPTAFFVFMEEFRKTYKEANPDCKKVSTAAREGGVQWKSMSDEEKKPYLDRAAELKAEYDKALESYNDDEKEDEDGGSHDEVGSVEKEAEAETISDDE